MGFEKFTRVGARGFQPKVTIWKGGQICFNQGAVRSLRLERFSHVILFFDAESNRIGFEFTNEGTAEGAIPLQRRDSMVVVSGKAFLDYYQVDRAAGIKADVKRDEESGLCVVQIAEEGGADDETEESPDFMG